MAVDPVDVADGDRGEVDLRTRVSGVVTEDVRMSALTSGWWLMSVVVVTG